MHSRSFSINNENLHSSPCGFIFGDKPRRVICSEPLQDLEVACFRPSHFSTMNERGGLILGTKPLSGEGTGRQLHNRICTAKIFGIIGAAMLDINGQ